MQYLIVFVMCLLATSKMSFQSAFGKKSVKNTADAVAFNTLVFLFSAILFSYKIYGCSPTVWIYASLGAASSVLFQLTYTKALSMGNVSLTVLIVNFQLVISTLFSYFAYGDSLTGARIAGIILILIAFVVCTDFKENQSASKKWFVLSIVAMVGTSCASIVQKIFGESPFAKESQAYVSCLYVVAAVMTLVIYWFMARRGERKTFKTGKRAILLSMAVGVSLAVFQVINTYAIRTVDGTFLFPAYSGGTIIFSTLSGVIIFKDTLNLRQGISILIGIVAIVLMNF